METNMMKYLMAGLLALLIGVAPAAAAKLQYKECDNKAAGCYVILIENDLTEGTAKTVADFVRENHVTSAVVWLDSPGGLFDEGIAIARLVRQYNFETYVGDGWECTSMCAVIWLAGSKRYYTGKAKIGFHGVYLSEVDKQGNLKKNGKVRPTSGGNAVLGAFFGQLGLGDEAIRKLTEASPDEMFWLNTKNVQEIGINAERWMPPTQQAPVQDNKPVQDRPIPPVRNG
jgi:hypothetical protein